jgi:hypothetical protein
VKTVLESEASLRNYREKIKEIRIDTSMHACVGACQHVLGAIRQNAGAELCCWSWVARHPQKFKKSMLETDFYHGFRLNFHIYKSQAPSSDLL